MALNFYQSNQKDTFGTLILSISIISRFVQINNSNDIVKLVIVSSILALSLNYIFDIIKIIFFRYWDAEEYYKGKGRYEYAWNHADFHAYRINFVFNIRLFLAILFLYIPDNSFSILQISMNKSFIFENIYSSYIFEKFGLFFLALVLVLMLYYGRYWYSILKSVRIFNSVDNWNLETRKLLRDESWEEVKSKLKKIAELSIKDIESIRAVIDNNFKSFKEKEKFDDQLLYYVIFEDEDFNWRKDLTFEFPASKIFENRDNLIPLLNENLSPQIFHLSKDLIKSIYFETAILNEPIKSFKQHYGVLELDYLEIFELILILYKIPINTLTAYIPENSTDTYTKENLLPLRNIVMDDLLAKEGINSISFTIQEKKGNNLILAYIYLLSRLENFKDTDLDNFFPKDAYELSEYFVKYSMFENKFISYKDEKIKMTILQSHDFYETRFLRIQSNLYWHVWIYQSINTYTRLNYESIDILIVKINEEIKYLFKYGLSRQLIRKLLNIRKKLENKKTIYEESDSNIPRKIKELYEKESKESIEKFQRSAKIF